MPFAETMAGNIRNAVCERVCCGRMKIRSLSTYDVKVRGSFVSRPNIYGASRLKGVAAFAYTAEADCFAMFLKKKND